MKPNEFRNNDKEPRLQGLPVFISLMKIVEGRAIKSACQEPGTTPFALLRCKVSPNQWIADVFILFDGAGWLQAVVETQQGHECYVAVNDILTYSSGQIHLDVLLRLPRQELSEMNLADKRLMEQSVAEFGRQVFG